MPASPARRTARRAGTADQFLRTARRGLSFQHVIAGDGLVSLFAHVALSCFWRAVDARGLAGNSGRNVELADGRPADGAWRQSMKSLTAGFTGTAISSRSSRMNPPPSSVPSIPPIAISTRTMPMQSAFLEGVAGRPDGLSACRCLHALACRDRLAHIPHAGHGDEFRRLSSVARLAGAGASSGTELHGLRAGHPLQPVPDAVRHHRHQHHQDLQPDQTVAGTGSRRAPSSGNGFPNWPTCR